MKTYKYCIVTTFRKHVVVKANSEEEAFDQVVNEELDGATDTFDFDTEIEEEN